ncbi:alpha/beta fold hydrolase [Pseudoxanthomonas wuyuanensis]
MNKLIACILMIAATVICPAATAQTDKPTIVLVHGAFAEASSWDGVTAILQNQGYPVVAVANPLRGVKSDAQYVSDIVDSIETPVVLVGHSYGGLVIGEAAGSGRNVKGLVFVAAFAAEAGETVTGHSGKFAGSSLGTALAPPVALTTGGKDLYIRQDKFHDQFAADVNEAEATLMAVSQRPVTEAALNEPAGTSGWKGVPSWFVHGDKDKNIPPAALAFMADRARSRKTVIVPGASHVVMVSHPDAIAELVLAAARSD